MKSKLITMSVLFVLVASALADEPLRHQEVLITANLIAADEIDTEFQTGHVTVIHRDEFDASATNIADVLKKESGVQIRSIGGLGTYSTISMRGSTSAQVNLYLDGVLINEAGSGAVDLSQFLLGNVKSIEIYRGNTPVQLGYSGIGGAVNIKTNSYDSKKTEGQFSYRLGSFDTKKASLSVGKKIDNVNYFASLEALESDNDFQLTNINKTPDIVSDDFLDRRNNGALNHFNIFTNINTHLDANSKITFTGQYFDKNQHLPDHINSEYNTAELGTDYLSLSIKYDHWFDTGFTGFLKPFFSQKNTLYDDRFGTLGLNKNLDSSTNEVFGITTQLSYSLDSHSLNLNLETKQEDYTIDDLLDNRRSSYSRTQASIGIQDEWINHTGDLIWVFSGRTFFTKDDVDRRYDSTSTRSSTLHTGISYQLNSAWTTKVNISSDIRLPNLTEKYGDQGYSVGNPQLENEEALNFDLGFVYKGSKLRAKSSFFYRDLDDAIFMIFDARGIGRSLNISEAQIMGLELDSSYQLNRYLDFSNRLTLQKTEDLTDSRQFGEGRSLPGISSIDNFFSITIRDGDLKVTLEHEHRSGGYYDRKNNTAIKNLNQANVKAVLMFPDSNSTLEVALNNLTGSKKEEFNGFRVEGVSLFTEYKINF